MDEALGRRASREVLDVVRVVAGMVAAVGALVDRIGRKVAAAMEGLRTELARHLKAWAA